MADAYGFYRASAAPKVALAAALVESAVGLQRLGGPAPDARRPVRLDLDADDRLLPLAVLAEVIEVGEHVLGFPCDLDAVDDGRHGSSPPIYELRSSPPRCDKSNGGRASAISREAITLARDDRRRRCHRCGGRTRGSRGASSPTRSTRSSASRERTCSPGAAPRSLSR